MTVGHDPAQFVVQRVLPGESDATGQLHALVYGSCGFRRYECVRRRRQHVSPYRRRPSDGARRLHDDGARFDLEDQ